MRVLGALVSCSLLALAVGCTDSGSNSARLYTRLGGHVINAETGQPVSGVVVKICNYEFQATTDGDGHWFMEIVPGLEDDDISITFERSGYASAGWEGQIRTGDELDIENRDFHDLGTTFMRPGVQVMVQVTLDGAPLAGVSVVATLGDFDFDGTFEYSYYDFPCTDIAILATTDSAGIALLNNIDPKQDYNVYVPMQDIDGDGIPDTSEGSVGVNVTYLGMVYAINVETMTPYGATAIRGTNLASYVDYFDNVLTGPIDGDASIFPYGVSDLGYRYYFLDSNSVEWVSFHQAVVTGNHSVQIVFRNPVDVFEAYFAYHNNLVALADPLFEEEVRIPATASAVSGSKFTIYNIVPSTLLPTNENVTLRFIARSRVNPAFSDNLSYSFYVPLAAPVITVAADNYNGSRDGTNESNFVSLRFAEAVEGFYKVLSFTEDGTTFTYENPGQRWIPDYDYFYPFYHSNVDIINNEEAAPATGANLGQSGAVAGKQVKVRVRDQFNDDIYLDDDVPGGSVNAITIEISVRNITGATLDTIITLPID